MRPPAVAGSFYPADPGELIALVDGLLGVAQSDDAVAYVVPHAGLRYSGPTAAHVYRRIPRTDRTVVIGPAHRVALRGIAVPVAQRWSTPLGPVDLDTGASAALVDAGLAVASDLPHAPEHSIEVQLPFLQRVHLKKLLPVCVGQASPGQVAAVLDAVVTPGTLLLCSTDLSHYLPESAARERDDRTVAAVVDLAPERVGEGDACGRYPLRGLLAWARRHRLTAEVLDVSTSADTGGSRERVVGYAAISLKRPHAD